MNRRLVLAVSMTILAAGAGSVLCEPAPVPAAQPLGPAAQPVSLGDQLPGLMQAQLYPDSEEMVFDAELLRRWDIEPKSYELLGEAGKKDVQRYIRLKEGTRLSQVALLKVLAGENWKKYVDEKEKPTQEGLALLRKAQAIADRMAAAEHSLATPRDSSLALGLTASLSNQGSSVEGVEAKQDSMFDGKLQEAGSVAASVGAAAVDVTAGGLFLDAMRLGAQALRLGDQAAGLGDLAGSLGAQAQAAAMAGDLATAQQLGNQAAAVGNQASSIGAQADSAGSKALAASKLGQTLTAVGGGLAVADGLWDIVTGILRARQEHTRLINERTVVGGVKTIGGGLQLWSLWAFMASPYLLGAGALLYLGASIYEHRHAIAEFINRAYDWLKSVFGAGEAKQAR